MRLLSCPADLTQAIFRPINGVRRSRPLTAPDLRRLSLSQLSALACGFFASCFRSKLRCITNRSSGGNDFHFPGQSHSRRAVTVLRFESQTRCRSRVGQPADNDSEIPATESWSSLSSESQRTRLVRIRAKELANTHKCGVLNFCVQIECHNKIPRLSTCPCRYGMDMTWFRMLRLCTMVHRPTDQCSDFEQSMLLICSSQFLLAMLVILLA